MVIPGYECITEYDEARHMAQIAREKAQLEKLAEDNLKKGRFLMLVDLVKTGLLSVSDAAKSANMTVSEFEAKTGLKTE